MLEGIICKICFSLCRCVYSKIKNSCVCGYEKVTIADKLWSMKKKKKKKIHKIHQVFQSRLVLKTSFSCLYPMTKKYPEAISPSMLSIYRYHTRKGCRMLNMCEYRVYEVDGIRKMWGFEFTYWDDFNPRTRGGCVFSVYESTYIQYIQSRTPPPLPPPPNQCETLTD